MNRFILIAMLCLAVSGCKEGKKVSKRAEAPLPLAVAVAVEEKIPQTNNFPSKITPYRSYTLQPRVSGYLKSKRFEGGEMVYNGEMLYTIDPAPFISAKEEALSEVQSDIALLQKAQSNYDRMVPLSKINAVSTTTFNEARATLLSAEQSLRASKAAADLAQLNIDYTTIKAPDHGIISTSEAEVGDYVGSDTKYSTLATIDYIDSVEVELSLPTKRYQELLGDDLTLKNKNIPLSNIEIVFSNGSTYLHEGFYRYQKQKVNSSSGSVVFVVGFPNPDYNLRSGEFVTVSADIGESRNKVIIPQQALSQEQGEYFVYVVEPDSTITMKNVTIGNPFGEMQVIESGIESGDMVLCEGFYKVKPGEKISPITTKL